jgi:hypothetical protein
MLKSMNRLLLGALEKVLQEGDDLKNRTEHLADRIRGNTENHSFIG